MISREHTPKSGKLDMKLSKFKAYLAKEAAVFQGKKQDRTVQADSSQTRFFESCEKLKYRRSLQEKIDNYLASLERNLERNKYSSLIMDLVDELRMEGEWAFSLLGLALELSQMEGRVATHSSLLVMIEKQPAETDRLRELRSKPSEEMSVLEQTWSQLDELREEPKGQLEEVEELKKSLDGRKTGKLPIPDTKGRQENAVANRETDAYSITKLHMRKLMRRKWDAVEAEAMDYAKYLIEEPPTPEDCKSMLWERQNLVERAMCDVVEMAPSGDEVAEYERLLKQCRPAFRGEMARLIAKAPDFAELVHDILDALMTKEVGAVEFLLVAIELAKNKEQMEPMEEILADLERDEPLRYFGANEILEKMTQVNSPAAHFKPDRFFTLKRPRPKGYRSADPIGSRSFIHVPVEAKERLMNLTKSGHGSSAHNNSAPDRIATRIQQLQLV